MTTSDYIEDAYIDFVKDIDKANNSIINTLNNVLYTFSNKGILEQDINRLAVLDDSIRNAFISSGYSNATNKLISILDDIEEQNVKSYKKDRIIVKNIGENDLVKSLKEVIISNLKGQGLSENILKPLENNIRQSILLNKKIEDTIGNLRSLIVEKNIIIKHTDRIVIDSIHQYHGTINNQIAIDNKLEWFYYIGSEIENTRPICSHIQDTYKGGAIKKSELKQILDIYCPAGIPSEDKITYETVNDVKKTAKKGAGMIDGTTIENFTINRGGYRCRHEVKWIRKPRN